MSQSLEAREYIQEFHKLDFNDRGEPGDELLINQLGYFMFDASKIDTYASSWHMAKNLYKADKIYITGNSLEYDALETLIANGLHLQIKMLDIHLNESHCNMISWKLLTQFTNLKLLYIDGSAPGSAPDFYTRHLPRCIPDITTYLPVSLEALSIVNMNYYNELFSPQLRNSNLKIINLNTLKFNQKLDNLPPTLESLIIESGAFNQPLDNLPSGLKHLVLLCPVFSQHLDTLPHGLEYFAGLHFNCFVYPENTYELELVNLPSSIKTIVLDEFLFTKQKDMLVEIYKDSKIICYDNFNNFEFIIKSLLDNIL